MVVLDKGGQIKPGIKKRLLVPAFGKKATRIFKAPRCNQKNTSKFGRGNFQGTAS